jgi:hypothetical protein
MKTLTAVLSVAAALSLGCSAATGPQSLPEDVRFDRIMSAYVDIETTPTEAVLMRELPRALAKQGYFINRTEPGIGGGYRFLTDWRVRPIYADEAFVGVQEARTRLIVDARRRGASYALSVYAISYLEDETGAWRQAAPSNEIRKQLRELSTQFALDMR